MRAVAKTTNKTTHVGVSLLQSCMPRFGSHSRFDNMLFQIRAIGIEMCLILNVINVFVQSPP